MLCQKDRTHHAVIRVVRSWYHTAQNSVRNTKPCTWENRSAAGRGYGSRWQKARKQYLESHPLYVQCMKEGRYVKAMDVDHVIPHRDDPKLFWVMWWHGKRIRSRCHKNDPEQDYDSPPPPYRYKNPIALSYCVRAGIF